MTLDTEKSPESSGGATVARCRSTLIRQIPSFVYAKTIGDAILPDFSRMTPIRNKSATIRTTVLARFVLPCFCRLIRFEMPRYLPVVLVRALCEKYFGMNTRDPLNFPSFAAMPSAPVLRSLSSIALNSVSIRSTEVESSSVVASSLFWYVISRFFLFNWTFPIIPLTLAHLTCL